MISPSDISAATTGPTVDLPALERAFLAFVAYPGGEGLSGFAGPDAMLSAFLDGVAAHLVGEFEPVTDDAYEVLRAYALAHGAPLLSPSYRDAAAMVTATWQGFAERFAAGLAATGPA